MIHGAPDNLFSVVNIQPSSFNDCSSIVNFSTFNVQNVIILFRSPLTKAQYPIFNSNNGKICSNTNGQSHSCILQFFNLNMSSWWKYSFRWVHWVSVTYKNGSSHFTYHSTLYKCKISENFLLDSGASMSYYQINFFKQMKHHIHYSCTSSNVKMTTVNSAVICSWCINLSFKIGNFF